MISSAFSQAAGGANQSLLNYGIYSTIIALFTYRSIGKPFINTLMISCMVTLGFALPYENSAGASNHITSITGRDGSAQPCSQIDPSLSGICSIWPIPKEAFQTEDMDTDAPSNIVMYHLTEEEASLYEAWDLENGTWTSGPTSILNQSGKRQDPTYEEDIHTIRDPPAYIDVDTWVCQQRPENAIAKLLENAIVGGVCSKITQFIGQATTTRVAAQLSSAGFLTPDGGFQPLRTLDGTPMIIIIQFLWERAPLFNSATCVTAWQNILNSKCFETQKAEVGEFGIRDQDGFQLTAQTYKKEG